MERDVVLHIGAHRTGTTSLQRVLSDNREHLLEAGTGYPTGMVLPESHLELCFASMRTERLDDLARFLDWALVQLEHPIRSCQDPAWFPTVRDNVRRAREGRLVFSHENLSLLRHADELDRLLDLFGDARVSVVMVHRRSEDFLTSYRWAMQVTGNVLSEEPDSPLYTNVDSWLVDYEARIGLWTDALGRDRVHVIDYERTMQEEGSTLPATLRAMRIELPGAGVDGYHLNARF